MLKPEDLSASQVDGLPETPAHELETVIYGANRDELNRWGLEGFYSAMPMELARVGAGIAIGKTMEKPASLPANFEHPSI
jgi:hypothetical protein